MKKILEIVILTGFFMAQLTFHAFAVDAQVTDVSVRQRWPSEGAPRLPARTGKTKGLQAM